LGKITPAAERTRVVAKRHGSACAVFEGDAGAVEAVLLHAHVPAADVAAGVVADEGFSEGVPKELARPAGQAEVNA
jgi:hypothetical protein